MTEASHHNQADCIFCQIAAGRIPSTRIYEDQDFIAFMDITPILEGHFLIVPRAHFALMEEMPPELLAKILPLARKLACAAQKGLKADGFNLMQNNGEAAGQTVYHWHLHVVPRRDPSELVIAPGAPADLMKLPFVAEKIRAEIK